MRFRTFVAVLFALGAIVVAMMAIVAIGRSSDTASSPTGPDQIPASPESVPPTPAPNPDPDEPALLPPELEEAAGDGLLAHPPTPPTARSAQVTRLADGDSFDIAWTDTGERDEIRLFGLNAPEANACFGQAAKEVLDVLIGDQAILVDIVDRDEFGRAISDVWLGPLFVNATLVELGAALTQSDSGSHTTLMSQAQTLAKAESAGLWDPRECGTDINSSMRISDIVADAPGRDNENPNGEWIEIMNRADQPTDLTGWSIRDESTRHRYSFPDGFELGPRATVRVLSGCGTDNSNDLYWCDGDPVWNNGGDTGFLVDASGRFIDTWSYGG